MDAAFEHIQDYRPYMIGLEVRDLQDMVQTYVENMLEFERLLLAAFDEKKGDDFVGKVLSKTPSVPSFMEWRRKVLTATESKLEFDGKQHADTLLWNALCYDEYSSGCQRPICKYNGCNCGQPIILPQRRLHVSYQEDDADYEDDDLWR